MYKNSYVFYLTLIIFFLFTASATATEDDNYGSGAALDDNMTTEQLEKFKKMEIEKDKLAENWYKNRVIPFSGEYYTLNLTNYKQEETHWCGPASTRQSLSFHRSDGTGGAVPSQTTLAAQLNTDNDGATTTSAIANVLTSYSGTWGRNLTYIASDISDQNNPQQTLRWRITWDLGGQTYKYAPILLVRTQHLAKYGSHSVRHYVTVSGYDNRGSEKVRYADPHHNNNYFGVYWDSFSNIYQAVYSADIQASSKAMAW